MLTDFRFVTFPISLLLLAMAPGVYSHPLEGINGKVSGGLGNVFRGYQYGYSGITPAIYVEKFWETGIYAGIWFGRFDWARDSYRDKEINYVAGFSYRFTPDLVVDTSLTHYRYPGASGLRDYNWKEWLTRLQINDQWAVSYGLGRDWFADDEYSHFVKMTRVFALPHLVELDINLGSVFLENTYLNNYQYVEAGVEKTIGRWNFRAQVSMTDSRLERLLGSSVTGTQYSLTASFLF